MKDDRDNKMFNHILLEPEQEELLTILVEAARNVPREERHEFIVARSGAGDTIIHSGLPGDHNLKSYVGDIHALAGVGLVNIMSVDQYGGPRFDITPLGFRYYQRMKQRSGLPVQQLEKEVRAYLDTQAFQERHPRSYEKWLEAEELLWRSDSQQQLTTIGHHCREAMQQFGTECVELYQPPAVDPNPEKTERRIMAVLEQRSAQLGETERPFLEALFAYWRALTALAQRQEHGARRTGEPLTWEDARRIVFQTAIVMFEIDRSLARSR